ncbi:hypothetical protein N7462_001757 [Penicillium macrosclerotiorum]|uniref:uncharacterized protein n=1 Tax=Penicillium macrosclerotiorum TaxID=303699 RepID=UPI00254864BB|nr:uncharacterized protein N7462_001757 [Penicillium macrosclerotiorum]KAJ5692334.1 hypothetical protein N7462_001757 [Penicillium macrosclerotiorum]
MRPQHFLASIALALPVLAGASSGYTKLGCYSTVPDLTDSAQDNYQAYGLCLSRCTKAGYKIAALTKGSTCACSNAIPPNSDKVDDSKCSAACTGYPSDHCGGENAYMVLSTGQYAVLSNSDNGATATATASTAAGGIVVAPTNMNPTSVPTGILTAPDSMVSKASSGAAASRTAGVTSSSATPSPTINAAGSLRAGSSVAGAFVAGLGLLL